ncbi:MAG: phage major capsid protein [Shimia sp.]|uniref:phage major capsid protein n=1 Tax=Shimia sp. TaxID=1954381 RepID=UPI003B8D73D2
MPKDDLTAIKDPAIKRKLDSEKDRLKAARLYDQFENELEDALDARKHVPALLGRIDALERTLARPVALEATLKQPAKPKGTPQTRVPATRLLGAAALAEMRRKAAQIAHADTLEKYLPGEAHKMARRTASRLLDYTKAATAPGTTVDLGWGAELVDLDLLAFWEAMKERSAGAQLRDIGVGINLGQFGSIMVPHRGANAAGDLKPAWVAEGATIPVGESTMGATSMWRFKLGIITLMTRELLDVSNALDVIEGFILDDLSEGLDTYLFDPASTAVAALKPSAITVGAPNQASAGDTLDNVLTDIGYLRSQLSAARRPAVVMHSDHMRALEMLQVDGRFPLEARVANRNLWGLQLIDSPYVPKANVIGVDAAAFYHAGDLPEIDTREAVTVAMASNDAPEPRMGDDDGVQATNDIQISDAAGTTPATVVRDTFQTNSAALRVVHPQTWSMMPNSVAYLSAVTWGG